VESSKGIYFPKKSGKKPLSNSRERSNLRKKAGENHSSGGIIEREKLWGSEASVSGAEESCTKKFTLSEFAKREDGEGALSLAISRGRPSSDCRSLCRKGHEGSGVGLGRGRGCEGLGLFNLA